MPYRFFALSNAGSMLGLLTYPVLVEPYLTNRQQAWMWSTTYRGVRRWLCATVAWRSRGARAPNAAAGHTTHARAALVRPPRLDGSRRLRVRAAAGGDQSPDAERRRHSVPLGAAAQSLSAELHPLLRQRPLVSALALHAPGRGCAAGHGLRDVERRRLFGLCDVGHVVRVFHASSARSSSSWFVMANWRAAVRTRRI